MIILLETEPTRRRSTAPMIPLPPEVWRLCAAALYCGGICLLWILTCLAGLLIFLVEVSLLYIWLAKIYLPPKCITPSKFFKRLKEIHTYRINIKKGVVSDPAAEQLFAENSDAFIEADLAILCVILFIYAMFSASLLGTIAAAPSSEYGILAEIGMAVVFVLTAKELWKEQNKYVTAKLDAFNDLFVALKIIQQAPQNTGIEDQPEDAAEPITAWLWLAIAFTLAAIILILYIDWTLGVAWDFTAEGLFHPKRLLAAFFLACASVCLLIDDLLGKRRIIQAVAKKFQKHRSGGEIEIIGLSPWAEHIRYMCGELNIHAVKIYLVSGDGSNLASCISQKDEPPIIQLDVCYMDKKVQEIPSADFYNMVHFLLAHELVHIYYGDSTGKGNRLMMLAALITACAGMAFFTLCLLYVDILLGALMFFVFCVYMGSVIFFAFGDDRYWGQVEEFRADRLGGRISGITASSFKQFCEYLDDNPAKKEKAEDDMHPKLATRVREMERYGGCRWGICDHLRYTWRFFWNLKIRRKWRM